MNKQLIKIKKILGKYILPLTPLRISQVGGILLGKKIRDFLKNVEITEDILDVGAQRKQYKKYFHPKKYFALDSEEKWEPDICCDAHNIKCEKDKFELVIATELLEHCYNPQKVVDEIYRVLKPGGICLISVPFMVPYHIAPGIKDYYRFSKDGLNYLFKNFSEIKVKGIGNRFQLIWSNINSGNLISRFFLNIFNPLVSLMNTKRDSNYPLEYFLTARKPIQ